MMFSKIRPCKDSDVPILQTLAKEDDHGVFYPTHTVIDPHNQIAGYFSLGVVPSVYLWLSTKSIGPRDSVQLINTVENLMFAKYRTVVTPVLKTSPFYPIMDKLGFKSIGDYTLFRKDS